MNKKIILKIKQLLALAEGATNVNEAISAAAAANQLMREYNLTKDSIDTKEERFFDYSEKIGRPWLGLRNPDEIVQALAGMVAKSNNCECYMMRWADEGGEFSGLSIVGLPVDVVAAEAIFWFLLSQLVSLSEKENPKNRISFWMGALHKLNERFKEVKRTGDLSNLNLNEYQIKFAIQRLNENQSKIDEYIKSIGSPKQYTEIVEIKDFDLGYFSASRVEIDRRKQLN